jgi:bacillopeptidase F (M6 metalloprotease family)
VTVDVTAYRGQTVKLWFNVHQDGYGDLTSMYLDDVSLAVS